MKPVSPRRPGNKIVVADKDESVYVWVILKTLQNFDEIKLQVTNANLIKAEILIKLFKAVGVEETKRELKEIEVFPENKQPYVLTDAFEITLVKHPALRR